MKYYLILNPGSKGGKSKKAFNTIFYILDNRDIHYHYDITSSLEDAYILSVKANKRDYDAIIAVGGDGTINRVINGFYNNSGKRISKTKFGVIYTGTSPDFCKSYNIPTNTEKAVNTLIKGESKKIKIGKIIHAVRNDERLKSININNDIFKTSYFACCANIGLGAYIARNANSGIRKYLGDFLGTFYSLINSLLKYRAEDMKVNIDGEIKNYDKVFNISIGKTPYIASGIKVKNNLNAEDLCLYNLTIKGLKLRNLMGILNIIYNGKVIKNNNIISLEYLKNIEIYKNSSNPEIEFDGDPGGFLPCSISFAQDSLDLICEV